MHFGFRTSLRYFYYLLVARNVIGKQERCNLIWLTFLALKEEKVKVLLPLFLAKVSAFKVFFSTYYPCSACLWFSQNASIPKRWLREGQDQHDVHSVVWTNYLPCTFLSLEWKMLLYNEKLETLRSLFVTPKGWGWK